VSGSAAILGVDVGGAECLRPWNCWGMGCVGAGTACTLEAVGTFRSSVWVGVVVAVVEVVVAAVVGVSKLVAVYSGCVVLAWVEIWVGAPEAVVGRVGVWALGAARFAFFAFTVSFVA
jgi:hypothetical protein